jgi:SAM-dependent methyltransferase
MTLVGTRIGKTDFYNESYKRENYFHYQSWVYAPYISSLIAYSGLKKESSVLDVGCGQGFFSSLFNKYGMRVHGIDLSEAGVEMARNQYGRPGLAFSVEDVETARFAEPFDCVFVRSCSLYNTKVFAVQKEVTHGLLKHLKTGGTFIFVYNSNFSSKESLKWRYHTLEDMRKHFAEYPDAHIFFQNRIITYLLGTYSFSPLVTRFNILLSRLSGLGGDLICILRKP